MDIELITIEPQNALTVFTTDGAIQPFLDKIRGEIDAFDADVSTNKGRKEVASFASKISKVKVYLDDGVGKKLAAEQKEIPKKIDACRKFVRDTLEAWRDEVREPLTEWENAEKARVDAHTSALTRLDQLADMSRQMVPSSQLREALAEVEGTPVGPECEEYEAAYAAAKKAAISALNEGIAAREKHEAEQAELAALRVAAEARAKKDREDQIAKEAAEKATRDAEIKAAAEKQKAEDDARREREAAEAREHALKQAAIDAERRAAQAVENARLEQEAARAAEAAEAQRRESNKAHRAKINRAAMEALVSGGIAEEAAKEVLKLIILKAIPAVTIQY